MKKISYGKQYIDKEDITAASKVIGSDWLTQGPAVEEFEKRIAGYCGAKYAVAMSSGTAALHLACLAAGLDQGDEAITTPITFLATPNSVVYAGAKPVFADIDYDTVNISPEAIEKKINKKTKVLMPVHFAGLPADMEAIGKIAKKHGLRIIEDACHALGAEYRHKGKWLKVGNCKHSDMTVFSFHPVKSITTGEGGAVLTNSKKLYDRLKALRSHGTYKDAGTAKKGRWYYEMRDLGFNYRITDVQCALGVSQLKKLKTFIKRRKEIADIYDKKFKNIDGIKMQPYSDNTKRSSWHLYLLRLDLDRLSCSRKRIFDELYERGIGVQVHYVPVFKQPFYAEKGYNGKGLVNSGKYYEEVISLPIYPSIKNSEIDRVVQTVKDVLKAAVK